MDCCKRRDLAVLITVGLLFLLYFNLRSLHGRTHDPETWSRKDGQSKQAEAVAAANGNGSAITFDSGPANSTLGFGAIVAVSKHGSKRRKGLLDAASVTDLHITIPNQPIWTDEDVATVQDRDYSITSKGSALAWLGHLNAARWFLSTNLTTVLIIEDDVDWDIHLRHHSVPLVAAQMRQLLSTNPTNPHDQYSSIRTPNRRPSYWGDLTQWEILYLGHCGDNFDLKFWSDLPRAVFRDESVPATAQLHPDTARWLSEAGIGPHQRMIHRSKSPFCTFAYALNRGSAERLLTDLSHEEEGHGTWSFDVRMLEACRDLGWKCWTMNPELFHHQDEHDSTITEVNGKPLFELHENVGEGTPNIACSARQAAAMMGGNRLVGSSASKGVREMAADPDPTRCDLRGAKSGGAAAAAGRKAGSVMPLTWVDG